MIISVLRGGGDARRHPPCRKPKETLIKTLKRLNIMIQRCGVCLRHTHLYLKTYKQQNTLKSIEYMMQRVLGLIIQLSAEGMDLRRICY
jgi:hypothetical protein